jgi:hypothetical protein
MTTSRRAPTPLSGFIDTTLRGRHGEPLGVVDELLVDLDSGRIEYLLATAPGGRRLQLRWEAVEILDGAFSFQGDPADLTIVGVAAGRN